jgi:DNA recombination protein RmuC
MTETLPIILLVLLVVLLVLGVVGLLRVAALSRTRDDEARAAARDAAEASARGDALRTQVAHVESDIRQDLANARAEQASTAAGLRNEVGGAIGKFREATQAQLTDMAGLQQRQLQGFGEQLVKLTLSNEQRLEAVRITIE